MALLKAAAEIVGEVGYQNASISLITQRAGVAQGTFYNHFSSRQDIFDQLLPALGEELLEYVRECAKNESTAEGKERESFAAFFSFQEKHPYFFRILNEAESFAPKAFEAHLQLVSNGYVSFLKHAKEHGELPAFEMEELEVVAFVLMAARSYLAWRYVYGTGQKKKIPPWVVDAYMKLVRQGIFAGSCVGTQEAGTRRISNAER
ncbi:TetR/AcrR family transcriptional regulator [Pseudorhodoferax sp.]|uniref:TetR/AcrR family transcriptional regulator n=1 Tax=Pseudorhodoferax sp. TaxID=1993553 RepID=UPI0039E39B96